MVWACEGLTMIRINLLPWRAIKYEHKKKQFLWGLGIVALLAIFIILAWHIYLGYSMRREKHYRAELTKKIQLLNQQINKYKIYAEQRKAMIRTIETINQFHWNRYQIANVFNNLPELIPQEIRLSLLQYNDPKLMLGGISRTNKILEQFVRQLGTVEWLKEPKLDVIHHTEQGTIKFNIQAQLQSSQANNAGTKKSDKTKT